LPPPVLLRMLFLVLFCVFCSSVTLCPLGPPFFPFFWLFLWRRRCSNEASVVSPPTHTHTHTHTHPLGLSVTEKRTLFYFFLPFSVFYKTLPPVLQSITTPPHSCICMLSVCFPSPTAASSCYWHHLHHHHHHHHCCCCCRCSIRVAGCFEY
jgi:ABC-type nickel/cobalt efflux system permease component RcnA